MSKYSHGPGDPLDLLEEECLEVAKEVIKARRFGLDGMPEYIASGKTGPRTNIEHELGDLLAVLDWADQLGLLSRERVEAFRAAKKVRMFQLFGVEIR